jgi:hypothetical protein
METGADIPTDDKDEATWIRHDAVVRSIRCCCDAPDVRREEA